MMDSKSRQINYLKALLRLEAIHLQFGMKMNILEYDSMTNIIEEFLGWIKDYPI